jgi:hypothetical protein
MDPTKRGRCCEDSSRPAKIKNCAAPPALSLQRSGRLADVILGVQQPTRVPPFSPSRYDDPVQQICDRIHLHVRARLAGYRHLTRHELELAFADLGEDVRRILGACSHRVD